MELINPYKVRLAPTLSGHWYRVWEGEDEIGIFPSATTILNAYPQSVQLTKWIADNGWNEANRLKSAAGEKGTNVHKAVEKLLAGDVLDQKYYSLEEWMKINSYVTWHEEYKPEVIATELAMFSREFGFCGTTDLVCRISDRLHIIDFKTSSTLYPHYYLQFAAYAHAFEEMFGEEVDETAGLLLGAKNKNGYRMSLSKNGWREDFEVFKAVQQTWKFDHNVGENFVPPVLELPETLQL